MGLGITLSSTLIPSSQSKKTLAEALAGSDYADYREIWGLLKANFGFGRPNKGDPRVWFCPSIRYCRKGKMVYHDPGTEGYACLLSILQLLQPDATDFPEWISGYYNYKLDGKMLTMVVDGPGEDDFYTAKDPLNNSKTSCIAEEFKYFLDQW